MPRQNCLSWDGARLLPTPTPGSINSYSKQKHVSWVHLPGLAMVLRYCRTPLTSGRSFAFSCQHFLAIFQTASDVPGASKRQGFGGRAPFKTALGTFQSLRSGKGACPTVS